MITLSCGTIPKRRGGSHLALYYAANIVVVDLFVLRVAWLQNTQLGLLMHPVDLPTLLSPRVSLSFAQYLEALKRFVDCFAIKAHVNIVALYLVSLFVSYDLEISQRGQMFLVGLE